jgi:DNA-binding Lrp family transcriptional regulator
MTTLDRTDIGILRLLQNNARLSNKEVASAVGLAPSSVHERLKSLWEAGVLRGAHAEIDPSVFGIGLEALFMIELSKHKRSTVDRFMADIAAVEEVRAAFLITGQHDVVVHVMVRDMQHLKDLALDHFTNRPGVNRIETSVIFDRRQRYDLPVFGHDGARRPARSVKGSQADKKRPRTLVRRDDRRPIS